MKFTLILLATYLSVINICSHSNQEIQSENLNYTIYFKTGFIWVPVGEMNMRTSKNDDQTTVFLSAKTFKKWKRFKDVELDIKAVYNHEAGYSESYLRESIENGIYIKDSIQFDQANLNVIEVIEESGKEPKEYSIALENKVVDILSSFNLVRSQITEYNLQKKIDFNLFYSRHIYDFAYTLEKRETKKIRKIGPRDCILLSTNSIDGRFFSKNSKLKIWMSANTDQSIPYMFETPYKFGKIRIVFNK